ncbi:MAG TPA: long-chain fatty acid--CoA ligase [Bryobacteraceae bacterium]|nr:long-chain fatty acid--CoA ligase [Bryobacteraceae bacterium]
MIAGDLLGERARLTPGKLALVEVHTGRRFTYAALDRRACAMARVWTRDFGLAKGDRVGILSGNRVEYVDAFFAAGKTGIVLVPLSTRLTPDEREAQIADAGVRTVLDSGTLDAMDLDAGAAFDPVPCAPEDLWCLLYTSGTTGKPKGVMLPHRMILWNACNTVLSWQLRENDIAPIFTPMYHAGGLAVFLTPIFAIGGTIVLHDRFDAPEVWRAVERERATVIFGVPTIFKLLSETAEFARAELSSVRWSISGGAPLPRYLIDLYQSRGIVFKQGYGLTEAGVNCFAMTEEDARLHAGSIGKPMLFAQVRVCDSTGSEVAAGQTGELWLRGPHVSAGFWNQPEATAAAFTPDGWLRTGDLAHCDAEGFYYIDGRIKDMFISGGVNVYPAEIEALLVQHPDVEEAAVIGVPDATWGEVGAAFVVVRADADRSAEDLARFLEPRIARYKLPKRYHFVKELPKTPYGKVVKPELLKRGAATP